MKKLSILLLATLGCLAVTPALAETAQEQANKKLVLAMADMLFVQHKVDQAVDTYFRPDYIQHNPLAANGTDAIRALFKGRYEKTPTATIVIKRAMADGDLVMVHYNGKSGPEDRGSAIVDIFRVQDGKIAEHWDVIQAVPEVSRNQNGMF